MKPYFAAATMTLALAACAVTAGDQPLGTTAGTATEAEAGSTDRLTLLGTGGGPIARVSRSQPANMLQVGNRTYLIDIGDGTARQIVAAGERPRAVDAVFITHLHFDHTAGLPSFIALDWQERRASPVTVYGPQGTQDLVAASIRFLSSAESIFRPQLHDLGPIADMFFGKDIDTTAEREVYSDGTVTVRAVENSHYQTVALPKRTYGQDRSYSYRFETGNRSIVFTGDTGPSMAVERLARRADILVSEVIDLPAIMKGLRARGAATGIDQEPLIDHMAKEHLTPENVGRLAAAAGVKHLVLSHFATPPGSEQADKQWMLAEIRKHYAGPVSFGEDLDVF